MNIVAKERFSVRQPKPLLIAASVACAFAVPAVAGNSLIVANQPVAVAKSVLTVTPAREWNKMGARPGRNSETWTLDGDTLNDLTFYGGIENTRTLFREVDKRNKPLPRFSSTMLITDVHTLFENSYRIAIGTPLMSIDAIEPTTVAGHKGVRFRYSFTRPNEEVRRLGEAHAAIVGGKLYMVTFEAPALHYFETGISAARAVVASA
jgi:hypothetical protein